MWLIKLPLEVHYLLDVMKLVCACEQLGCVD